MNLQVSAVLPDAMVALVALGMAIAFLSADRRSASSRALALALCCIGIALAPNASLLYRGGQMGSGQGWLAIPESMAVISLLEWVMRVRRTVPAADFEVRAGDHMLRLGQCMGVLYAVLSVTFPDLRAHDFLFAASTPGALLRPGFWLFAVPILFATGTGLLSGALLLNRKPDRPERIRLISLGLATPFLVSGFVVPPTASAIMVLIGQMIFLVGAVQYHVMQGQRGQFMSRFLSDQVASLVRDRGLNGAMQQNHLEITVVVSDLRGFTAYAQAHPSSRVIEVLSDYYDAVGQVVAQFGGTIKDFAGDGILILVGAPIPMANHAATGLAIARGVRDEAGRVTRRWSSDGYRLGVGIGVASGFVTVGVIGAAARLEYTAVGPAVNLASRLCESAAGGEILVDGRTHELARGEALDSREPITVKGFEEPVALFALPAVA